jgi:hypothetical protein
MTGSGADIAFDRIPSRPLTAMGGAAPAALARTRLG